MRMTAVLRCLALASLALVAVARGSEAPAHGRPADVPAPQWIPITRDLGFVVERSELARLSGSTSSVLGYFVARPHGTWVRLDSIPQAGLLRWPLIRGPAGSRVRITSNLAFVIEKRNAELGGPRTHAVAGYFVTERKGHWLRLDPVAHGALFGGPLTARPGGSRSVLITANLSFVVERPPPEQQHARLPSAFGYFVVAQNGRSLQLNPIANAADEPLR